MTKTQIAEDIEQWCRAKYDEARRNGADDAQALAAVRSLFLEGVRAGAR